MKAIENLIIHNKREKAFIDIWSRMAIKDIELNYGEPLVNIRRDLKGVLKRLHNKNYLKKSEYEFIENAFKVYEFCEAIFVSRLMIENGFKRMRKDDDNVFFQQGYHKK